MMAKLTAEQTAVIIGLKDEGHSTRDVALMVSERFNIQISHMTIKRIWDRCEESPVRVKKAAPECLPEGRTSRPLLLPVTTTLNLECEELDFLINEMALHIRRNGGRRSPLAISILAKVYGVKEVKSHENNQQSD